jgi:hypothetical protein
MLRVKESVMQFKKKKGEDGNDDIKKMKERMERGKKLGWRIGNK